MESNQGKFRPASAVVTLPDPDNSSTSSYVEIGGTLEIRCDSPNYPTFHVIFQGANPSDKEEGHVFEGSIHQPLVIRIEKEGDFDYTVVHFPKHEGRPIHVFNKSRARSCPGCR